MSEWAMSKWANSQPCLFYRVANPDQCPPDKSYFAGYGLITGIRPTLVCPAKKFMLKSQTLLYKDCFKNFFWFLSLGNGSRLATSLTQLWIRTKFIQICDLRFSAESLPFVTFFYFPVLIILIYCCSGTLWSPSSATWKRSGRRWRTSLSSPGIHFNSISFF